MTTSSIDTADDSMCAADGLRIKVVPNSKLFISEPNPSWFGNGPNERHNPSWTNENWLKSRFHFSFAEYHNPSNSNFGVLRVMNDDLVQPKRGFGEHPHRDMEIITYIVEGSLTHKDSMGTKETLGRGSVQFMTAGKGVYHSEFNDNDKPLRFIQTWIVPSRRGLTPNYGSYNGKSNAGERKNKLQHLVSNVLDNSKKTPVEVNQDVDTYAAEIDLDKSVTTPISPGRQGYLLCIEGEVNVNGKTLKRHDACEITGNGGLLTVEATRVDNTENGEVAHVLLFTMSTVPGSGRSDF